jgi:hypothetical protein
MVVEASSLAARTAFSGRALDSMHYLKIGVSVGGGAEMGAAIMLGTLFGLIVLIFGLVLRYDPEARRTPRRERDR